MSFTSRLNSSAIWTIVGIAFMFSFAVVITLFAPSYVDPSWTNPSSSYQVQMYEVADPNIYVSTTVPTGRAIQYVYHLKDGETLLAFQESPTLSISAPEELKRYVTPHGAPLVLTSRLLLLRPTSSKANGASNLELYDPGLGEAFALAETDGVSENWVDTNFTLLDSAQPSGGVLYVANPTEYRIRKRQVGRLEGWEYDPNGQPVATLADLKGSDLGFLSRQELIRMGEHIFAIEGCWYCHTDQSRTLVSDCVLNGTESYPAPPSSANEYIYQNVTFPGTRRIGPDLARVGVKRPTRDWHMAHFLSPKTESPGSIMPAFTHFFDDDPRGSPLNPYGVPNYRFEAVFQYLMTKGTRITPPTQAWWRGKDPVDTLAILDGRKE